MSTDVSCSKPSETPTFHERAENLWDWLRSKTDSEAIANYDDSTRYPRHYRLKGDDPRTTFLGHCDGLIVDYVQRQPKLCENLGEYRLVMALLLATVPRAKGEVRTKYIFGASGITAQIPERVNEKAEAESLLRSLLHLQRCDDDGQSTGSALECLTEERQRELIDEGCARQVREAVGEYLGTKDKPDAGRSEIDKLEKTTPPLKRDNIDWVPNTQAAELEGVKVGTLKKYRQTGIRQADGTLGRDKDGRVWRRKGTQNSHPWYYKPSLISQRTPLSSRSAAPNKPSAKTRG